MINPGFTPVELVKQSALIVEVDVKQGKSQEQYVATVGGVVKGKTDLKAYSLDLSKARNAEAAESFRTLAATDGRGLLFIGEMENEDEDEGENEAICLLHISGKWAACVAGDVGSLVFDIVSLEKEAVWAGGTDMLRRAVDYILNDDYPVVPTAEGVSWSEGPQKVATLDGTIYGGAAG